MNREYEAAGQATAAVELAPCLEVRNLSLHYAKTRQALNKIRLTIPRQRVTALIGPSGCGKTSLLRCFNRLNDLVDDCVVTGRIRLEGKNIYSSKIDVTELRRRVGMVFQKPNPFPKSIYENVAFGLRIRGINSRRRLDEIVQESLEAAALWDEVKDRLHGSALELSGGQQQRLVIARTLAVEPEVLLLDESASALDPISTLKIEELITGLKKELHHRHSHAQSAAGGTGFRLYGLHVHGQHGGIRHHRPDFHQPGQTADRRLYYWQVWVRFPAWHNPPTNRARTSRASSARNWKRSARICCAWAGRSRRP